MALNKNLQDRADTIIKAFEDAKLDGKVLEAAARNADANPQVFDKAIKEKLTQFNNYIIKIEKDAHKDKKYEISENIYNFLNGLADISPYFARTMKEQGLSGLERKDFINDPELLKKLKNMLAAIAKNNMDQKWYNDLAMALKEYYQNTADKSQTKLGKLIKSAPVHADAAQKEIDKLSSAAIEYRANSGLYDPVKALGSFLSSLLNTRYIAPLEDAMYPEAKLPDQEINGDASKQLNLARRGMVV